MCSVYEVCVRYVCVCMFVVCVVCVMCLCVWGVSVMSVDVRMYQKIVRIEMKIVADSDSPRQLSSCEKIIIVNQIF